MHVCEHVQFLFGLFRIVNTQNAQTPIKRRTPGFYMRKLRIPYATTFSTPELFHACALGKKAKALESADASACTRENT